MHWDTPRYSEIHKDTLRYIEIHRNTPRCSEIHRNTAKYTKRSLISIEVDIQLNHQGTCRKHIMEERITALSDTTEKCEIIRCQFI